MRDYMAPMEGITNYVYRNAYHQHFHAMDKYFTPFISAKPNKRLSNKEVNEISPETNQGMYIVPQIMTKNAEDFLQTTEILMEYGHKEVNLNLGCPSGTVTAKGKGAGFLAAPEMLDRFLDEVFQKIGNLDVKLSIKTRIGTDYEDEWQRLMEIYNQYPLEELIIHPRLLIDYYKNTPHLDVYQQAVTGATASLCYNGDLFSKEAYEKISARFPETECFMYGRGLIANPGLITEIRDGKKMDKQTLRAFHDEIYASYKEIMSGDRNVLFRMKELWAHMIKIFDNNEKYAKKIRKAQKCGEYDAAVSSLFAEQELNV